MYTIAVLTISDRASAGVYPDTSGPAIVEIILQKYPDAQITQEIIPDNPMLLRSFFSHHLTCNCIITTGGTGIGPRDFTPEITTDFCSYLVPGIAEMFRFESIKVTKNAVFSRGVVGVKHKTLIVNFPGSHKAALLHTELLLSIFDHAMSMMHGKGHE